MKILFVGLNSKITKQPKTWKNNYFYYIGCTEKTELDKYLELFNSSLKNHEIWKYSKVKDGIKITYQDFFYAQKIFERHITKIINPEDMRSMIHGSISYWVDFFQNNEFDLIVYGSASPHWVWDSSISIAAKLEKIQQVTIVADFISDKIKLMDFPGNNVYALSEINNIDTSIVEFCNIQKKHIEHPEYINSYLKNKQNLFFTMMITGLKRIIQDTGYIRKNSFIDQFFDSNKNALMQAIYKYLYDVRNLILLRYLKIQYIKNQDNDIFKKFGNEKKIAIFFANYQPEATTTPDAGLYSNTKLIIAELIQNGYLVIYKEHPTTFLYSINKTLNRAAIYKSRYYYNDLKKMGVLLAPTNVDNNGLISASDVTVTCTGTIGLQALLKGARTLILGRTWYGLPPGSFDDINALKNTPLNATETDVIEYLTKRWSGGLPNVAGVMTGVPIGSTEDIIQFFNQIIKYANKIKCD